MVKVKYMPGIDAVSGTMKSKTGNRLEFRHLKYDKPGEGHFYIRKANAYQRKSKLSDKEIRARSKFGQVMQTLAQLTPEAWQAYEVNFKQDRGQFYGKTYKTLRAYVIARLFKTID